MKTFWRKWTRDYFPGLIAQEKWHTEKRNVSLNDVVLVKDGKSFRGEWRLARVTKIIESKDGKVRKVEVSYRNLDSTSQAFISVDRAIHNLVVIVPAEE